MSKPFNTSPPTLVYVDGQLRASNGGWDSYSGMVVPRYRFVFDAAAPAPLGNTDPYALPPVNEYPGNPAANLVGSPSPGEHWCWVAAGTHSKHVRGDGTVAYDVIEWSDWVKTNVVTVPATPPPPSPPPDLYPASEVKRVYYDEVRKYRERRSDEVVRGTRIYAAYRVLLSDDAFWSGDGGVAVRKALGL